MGIPIPVIEVDANRARSNICLAADCQCPECRHRHIIRLGSAIRQTRRREQQQHNGIDNSSASSNTITGMGAPSGYIDTHLPDYRFRHSLNNPDLSTMMGDYHIRPQPQRQRAPGEGDGIREEINNSNNNYSTSALLNRRRALGYRGPPLTQLLSSSSSSVSNFLAPMGIGMGAREPYTTSPTSTVDNQDHNQDQE
ncbi:hypothetical protein BGX29_012200 [Mortierella sp. GBA35]|nr:hypothetical protein BGX29_012200 [Mortierella sp. GBA35]